MSTPQHPHADHVAAIAHHLDKTPEATAPDQRAGVPYIAEEGCYFRRMFHSEHGGGVVFGYSIIAYDHVSDISVEVQQEDIESRIQVPGDTPADVIALAVMSALRSTIDVIQQVEHES